MQLDGHNKHRFGSRSESLDQLALELVLEEHEIAQAAVEGEGAASLDNDAKSPRTPRERKPFPKDLERVETRITPSDACTECGGSFKELGKDVMEELEYVPGHYIVNQIIRPRLACTCCEAVTQAEMPSRPIPKSFVGPALMAHILASKYGYHLPLYRQSQMFENQGIDLSGSLLASWVGKCTRLLERVSDEICDHVMASQAIFMDDTTVKLLQKGRGKGKNKTKTARLWVYVRDERAWSSTSPPAAWYQFSTSRGAEHPSKHLGTYTGFAHADAYAGYNDAYRTLGRKNYLFMGAEAGGYSAAIAYILIETCKLNGVNSEAWLAWLLEHIQDHPVNSINELLPWNYQAMIDEQKIA